FVFRYSSFTEIQRRLLLISMSLLSDELGVNEKMKPAEENKPEFDKFARDYEALFKPWLKIAGGSREFFARARLNWLADLLRNQQIAPKRVMDFGCGTGISLPLLADILGAEQVI